MDLAGGIRHTWRLPGRRQCEYARLLDDGTLAVVCVGQSLTLLDWRSRVLWELRLPVHHDVGVLSDGSFLVPRVEDWRPYRGRRVFFDGLVHVSVGGTPRFPWSSFERLPQLRKLHRPTRLDTPPSTPVPARERFDYYHLNSVQVLPETPLGARDPRFRAGNLLVCLRNVDLVLVLDRDDHHVTWHWGEGVLDFPHMPTLLANGHILVFDNGTRRGFSRVLEVDPERGEIVWSYEGEPREAFFSKWRGSSQRLVNGNTLICESDRGHAFEVTPAGEVVWEFWNPEVEGGRRKRIYRLLRLPPEPVEALLRTAATAGGD